MGRTEDVIATALLAPGARDGSGAGELRGDESPPPLLCEHTAREVRRKLVHVLGHAPKR
jgi:hypothetical protein